MQKNSVRKEFRRFKEEDYYRDIEDNNFSLLPFNFRRLKSGNELLINFIGDHLIVPQGTSKLITEKKQNILSEDLYNDLLSHNFIYEGLQPKNLEILSNRYRAKKPNTLSFAQLHIFVITLRCEHTCQYCQVSRVSQNKDKYDFESSNLFKAINLMLASPEKNLTMEFQGGEALLAFDKIKLAIDYTKEKAIKFGKKINYVICTNLAPITEEILLYCKAENILISCSLDGPKELHNANRIRPGRNSYELVQKGLDLCKNIIGIENVSALMTTTTLSLEYPIEIIEEYRNQGFNSVFLRPISPYGFATKNKRSQYHTEDFLKFFKIGLDYIIQLNKDGIYFKETYTSILLKKVLTSYSESYVDLMSPSGLINSVILYDYNGKIYASDEARMLAQMNDDTFLLGTVENTWKEILENETIDKIADSGVNDCLAGCESCAYKIYCGSDPVLHHATQGDMYGYRPTSSFCKRNMSVLDILFDYIDNDREVLEIFQSWINNE